MDFANLANLAWQRFQSAGIIFYWPYLVSAFVITLAYLKVTCRMRIVEAFAHIFARKVWLTRSTRTDLVLSTGYALVFSLPAAILQAYVFFKMFRFLDEHLLANWTVRWPLQLSPLAEGVLVTFVAMMSIDFATYVVHYLMHKVRWLWDIHAVHHSAEQLTLLSTHRQNPLEPFILNFFRGAFAGCGVALFYYVFPQRTPIMTVMGLGAGFFIYMFTVNLHHSHVPVRYPRWLRIVVLSPHVHHIHHSKARRHWDKNFGVVFPWWDMLFGTYCDEEVAPGALEFGLDPAQDPFKHSLWKCVAYPIYAPLVRLLRPSAISRVGKDEPRAEDPEQAA